MSDGTDVREGNELLLSDTTLKVIEVVKILRGIVTDREADRSTKFHARQALNSLSMLITNAVAG